METTFISVPLQIKHLRSGVKFLTAEDSKVYEVVRRRNNLIMCRRYIGNFRYTIVYFQATLIIHKILQ